MSSISVAVCVLISLPLNLPKILNKVALALLLLVCSGRWCCCGGGTTADEEDESFMFEIKQEFVNCLKFVRACVDSIVTDKGAARFFLFFCFRVCREIAKRKSRCNKTTEQISEFFSSQFTKEMGECKYVCMIRKHCAWHTY